MAKKKPDINTELERPIFSPTQLKDIGFKVSMSFLDRLHLHQFKIKFTTFIKRIQTMLRIYSKIKQT